MVFFFYFKHLVMATSGPVLCFLLGVSSGCACPITGQVTSVTWPVIGSAWSKLNPCRRQKTGPDKAHLSSWATYSLSLHTRQVHDRQIVATTSIIAQGANWRCKTFHPQIAILASPSIHPTYTMTSGLTWKSELSMWCLVNAFHCLRNTLLPQVKIICESLLIPFIYVIYRIYHT